MDPISRCAGPAPFSRRRVLQAGGASMLGLGLPRLLRAERGARTASPRADACILIFLNGGPSQLDMWDMKPDAPTEIRGEFKPIATTVPGLSVCEHLPRLAKVMHLGTLIRSAQHGVVNAHGAAVYTGLTGHDRGEKTDGRGGTAATDYPAIGSVAGLIRPVDPTAIPFVSMPYITAEGAGGPPQPGFFGGWLGRNRDPLFILKDPNTPDFGMPELSPPPEVGPERFGGRRRLAGDLGGTPLGFGDDRKLRDMDGFQARAFDLLTSPRARAAFRLDREDPKLRDAYGRNIYGQSVLLARRLIEAGTRVATISWAPDANATWDTHGNNFPTLKNRLLPQLDAAVSSLLGDLEARGMLDRTVVAVMGEFGRSPRVNGMAGRDHWPHGYSLFLAGGGIKGGYIHGTSDKIAARPTSHPVSPAEIVATIYECLGIPADLELRDRFERPFGLVPWGRPIADILA